MKISDFTKGCRALSHPLRSQIFIYLRDNGPVKVTDIANNFNIHPNLARGHLSLLEEINITRSKFIKQEKGAPYKSYEIKEDFICLNFPACPLKTETPSPEPATH